MRTTHKEIDWGWLEVVTSIYLWYAINRYMCAFKSQQSLETGDKCKYSVHLKYNKLFDFIIVINGTSRFNNINLYHIDIFKNKIMF